MPIKDDSEYPDWIWTMRLTTPPKASELEPDTREYWEQLALESNTTLKKFMSVRHRTTKRVGERERAKMEWQQRIKFRALAAYNYEPGYRPEDVNPNQPHMKMWLRPQEDEEEIFADQFVKENGDKFFKHSFNEPVELRQVRQLSLKGYRDETGGVKALPAAADDDSAINVANKG